MKLATVLILAVASATPVRAQFVGQTCGPSGCNPILPAPEPSARALIQSSYVECGSLAFFVYFVNDNKVPVRAPLTFSDTWLRADGINLHPKFEREGVEQEIAPGSFAGPFRFSAMIPKSATGNGEFVWGSFPAFSIKFATGNGCPKAER